jgi:hypothetical protein
MWELGRGTENKDGATPKTGVTGTPPVTPVTARPLSGPPLANTSTEAQDRHAASTTTANGPGSPALDRAVGDASGRSDAEAQRLTAGRGEAPPSPVPHDYGGYSAHLKDKYSADFEAMRAHREQFEAEGGAEKRKNQKLALTPEEVTAKKEELKKKEGTLSEEDLASERAKINAMEQALPSANKTMPELKSEAEKLNAQIKAAGGNPKDPAVIEARNKLEGVMQASILLGTQIDPKGTKLGRELYNKLDKIENPALTDQARAQGESEEDVAHGAVDQRNWLRKFVRSEMMDPTAAEILYLRDEGKTGSREGMSYDQVQAKEVGKLKKEGELPKDFDMAKASPEDQGKVYAAVIGSARTTNTGVNASATGSSTGGVSEPEKKKPDER